ncbi:hypothetical protein BJY04DRAFT_186780 [Aspergillus karnatakaensis]|uniref:uncharacterized protein n=1 Tax=Aspergillus karnatakaensis TaxID=1810916 RepID=UPI003CCCC932
MLSRTKTMFRKLRGKRSHDSKPEPSAPATIAKTEPVGPPPRAINHSELASLPREVTSKIKTQGNMVVVVANAKGAISDLYYLSQTEQDGGWYDPTDTFESRFVCGDCIYTISFMRAQELWPYAAMISIYQHVCLVFTYDASSTESWDEIVATCEAMRSRCKDGASPFVATIIGAQVKSEDEVVVSHAEAEAFATQRGYRFFKFSPRTGHGASDAIGSLVERAYSARDQHTDDQAGQDQRRKRAEEIVGLFPRGKMVSR